ncbi:putative PIN and TRAM-domain containing protein YacL [Compostibacillus humi]|uniref:Putative PIN and TRAM-domain containing protein YacL n=1 Tax=Compostibacillus humi TaxID=1245525 RepID=A0A8J2TPD7_9BACI|nr:PIN/TRAM domain-containing protein [Compostibacillus humi]GFZ79694.1 putative PIN and TRAM-domain containing protein YacL [Compostibacillus humi]HLT55965.1 PIN/TRAM domain-containing protein [Bacillota bacterium]
MLKIIVHLFFVVLGGTIGFIYVPNIIQLLEFADVAWLTSPYIGMVIGAIIFFLISYFLSGYIVDFLKWIEEALIKLPAVDLFFGSLGLIIGLVIAYFINRPLQDINIEVISQVLPLFIMILLGYFGFTVGFKRRDEFINLLRSSGRKDKRKAEEEETESSQPRAKILDTSVIIDGRIADICQTNFLEGTIVIPQFVLEELQHIADSSDALKRNRGRRGLDVLNRIQKELPVKVEIYEGDFEEIQEVDSKLIKLAKVINGIIVTNDFNLNKVCDLQGVNVLNINDLANAVKPVVLPGEELVVQVIKDGKEHNQGVAYLDDGTMIVVEEGKNYIGKTIEVLITSVLQTSAGRMIFAKPKLLEKAL